MYKEEQEQEYYVISDGTNMKTHFAWITKHTYTYTTVVSYHPRILSAISIKSLQLMDACVNFGGKTSLR